MKKNGFLSSALLYGIIALFIVLMLSTLAILGNRKLSTDKLKQNALDKIQAGYISENKIYAVYDSYKRPEKSGGDYIWRDQSENSHNATLKGFPNNFYVDRSIQFSGNQYIDTGISLSSLGNNFTITMVLRLDTNNPSTGILGDYSGDNQGIFLENTSNNRTKACYYGDYTDPSNNVVRLQTCSATPTTDSYNGLYGKKVELTLVYQSGVGVYIYRNGVRINYETDGIEFSDSFRRTMRVGSNRLIIGRSSAGNPRRFYGNLYSVVIYKGIMSGSQVAENFAYNKGKYDIPNN